MICRKSGCVNASVLMSLSLSNEQGDRLKEGGERDKRSLSFIRSDLEYVPSHLFFQVARWPSGMLPPLHLYVHAQLNLLPFTPGHGRTLHNLPVPVYKNMTAPVFDGKHA